MKIANLKFEIGGKAIGQMHAARLDKACARKKSESPHVDSYNRKNGLRNVRCVARTDGPMRFGGACRLKAELHTQRAIDLKILFHHRGIETRRVEWFRGSRREEALNKIRRSIEEEIR